MTGTCLNDDTFLHVSIVLFHVLMISLLVIGYQHTKLKAKR